MENFEKKEEKLQKSTDKEIQDLLKNTELDTVAEGDFGEKKVLDKKRIIKNIITWVIDIAVAFLIAFIVMQFFTPTIVKEQSMDNTLHEDDYLVLATKAYNFHKIEHGDIVVFKSDLPAEEGGTKNLIKRVIGLPGDTISIENGHVVRNGKVLDEKYTRDGWTDTDMVETKVPKGKLFCMGDNRAVSLDSRDPAVGLVSDKTVVGKAVFRVYPFKKFGGLYKYKE